MPHRVLVTGGAGFVGSNLCARLIALGHTVVALDDLTTGRLENISGLRGSDRFTFVHHDVCAPFADGAAVDRVYNLACPASPPHYQRDPVRTMLINVLGMKHALDYAGRHGARVLQASTSEIYGDPLVHPQVESYRGNVSSTGPRACYDEGKRAAEALIYDYARAHAADVRVARIFNTYGPNMAPDDGRVVSNFVVQALRGEPITIYGDGSQTRSFCYVDDLVDGLIRLMEGPCTEPVNLGNPGEFTVKELAEQVLAKIGGRSEIVYRPLPIDDPTRRKPNIERAWRELGWAPKVSLADGLVPTIRYFAERVSA